MTELPGDSAAPASESATPRPGVPVWRVGKPDAFLAADVATARNAILSIAGDAEIGAHLGARSEGVRCVTHLFESKKDGYRGWTWFASLARVSRGKESTVNEVGMLPTEDSILAPQWVPWAERVRPEDQEAAEAEAAAHAEERRDAGDPATEDVDPATEDVDAADSDAGDNGVEEDSDSEESAESEHADHGDDAAE